MVQNYKEIYKNGKLFKIILKKVFRFGKVAMILATFLNSFCSFQPTVLPGFTSRSVVMTLSDPSKFSALRIMP